MDTLHIKTWIERIGSVIALLCALWALYLEIVASQDYALLNTWWKATFGILVVTWVLAWLVGRYGGAGNSR
jgi:hypothetical protein